MRATFFGGIYRATVLVAASLAGAMAADDVAAQGGFGVQRVVGGLNRPLYATHAPGDPNALYIVQQRLGGTGADLTTGSILRYDLTGGATTTFLQLPGLDTDSQGGLHSLAFHPDYQPGVPGSKFYLVALRPSGSTLISTSHLEEWVLNVAGTPTYNRTLLQVVGRQFDDATHAVDWIGFKPGATGAERNWLYVSNGDGGIQCCGGGYVNNSQDLNSMYGKVLRLGVGGGDDRPTDATRNYEFTPTIYHNDNEATPGGPGATAPEVLYSGFRNPWRASFDRLTGDFWLGDVGAGSWEEINYVKQGVIGRDASGNPAAPGAGAAFGIDFGWSRREGPDSLQGALDPDGGGLRPNSVNPLVAFPHSGPDQHNSITGGYVYRGPNASPGIQGKYFWTDAFTNRSYVASLTASGTLQYQNITTQLNNSLAGTGLALNRIVSYAEDAAGNLYLMDFGLPGSGGNETGWDAARSQFGTGEIYRISYVEPPVVTINRDTGAFSVAAASGTLRLMGYTVESNSGTLIPENWAKISGRLDAPSNGGDGSFDADDIWKAGLVTPASPQDLQEAMLLDGAPDDGGPLGTTPLTLNIAGNRLWRKYFLEDVSVVLTVQNPAVVGGTLQLSAAVNFVGNGGVQYRRSDLNFDGSINKGDYVILLNNHRKPMNAFQTDPQSYPLGDLDGDQDNDFLDFRIFQADYIAAYGETAFAEMLASVPEPSNVLLIAMGLGIGLLRPRGCQTAHGETGG